MPTCLREIEVLSATAPQAKVNLYTSADTDLDTGMIFATIRAVEDNDVQVLVFGFESCEANLGPIINSSLRGASGSRPRRKECR